MNKHQKPSDITLLGSEERYRLLINCVKDYAIFMLDPLGHVMTWNEGAGHILGYTSDEIVGQHMSVFYTTEKIRQGEPAHNLTRARETGRFEKEDCCIRKNGLPFWANIVLTAIYDPAGELLGFAEVTRDITESKKDEALLQQSYQDIRQLASHLQDIREEERAGIAREIHDELGQQLTGLKMDLFWISKRIPPGENDDVRQKVTGTLDLLDTTIQTVRRIATDLRPDILDNLGLIAAIEWQGQEFQKRSGIPTTVISGLSEFKGSSAIAIGLFRICQESLTNIARYAAAEHVFITLQKKGNGSIQLKIEDDGNGFDTCKVGHKKTLGLLGMKERALMMGGDFRIISHPGQGTTLSVTAPLKIRAA